jgi:hypothetical protein
MLPALDVTTLGGGVVGVCAPIVVVIASREMRSVDERGIRERM